MSFKETKRKGFNFFRSYFDVYNELDSDKNKLAFIDALLERQFLGIKPTNLKGMAKFAYISQTNSIDAQVKGYEDKTGNKLTPCLPPKQGGTDTPTVQVEEKGEVEEKVENYIKSNNPFSDSFIEIWDQWKEYKKEEHKFNYKSKKTEKVAMDDLLIKSNGDERTAKQIIHQSIANGWKGFFELKKENGSNGKSSIKLPAWKQ